MEWGFETVTGLDRYGIAAGKKMNEKQHAQVAIPNYTSSYFEILNEIYSVLMMEQMKQISDNQTFFFSSIQIPLAKKNWFFF